MRSDEILEKIKAFGMTNQLVTHELRNISTAFGIDLGHTTELPSSVAESYYPQFDLAVRKEASTMAQHYEAFYCLEKSIRALVAQQIETNDKTESWWTPPRIPQKIFDDVRDRIQREKDSGITLRSTDELDYTTFGELSMIIGANWDIFGGLFSSKKAVEKVMASLNSLRGPIAHCSPLADDEVVRLQLTVRDWFRLME
jgi:hypothetical protein